MNHAPLLSTITDHWQAQGWSPDSLDAFRMEGEGAAAPTLDSIIDQGLANEPADETAATETATETATEPATPAAPAPSPAGDTATPAGDDGPPEWINDPGKAYAEIQRLRGEAGTYRTERNQLQDTFGHAFDGYEQADRDTLLTVARMLRSDDPGERAAAGEWMRDQGDALLASAPADPSGDTPLTAAQVAAEVDRVLSQREQTKADADAQAARLTAINDECKALGLEPGSVDTQVVLSIALHETNGDIKAAHEKLVARDRSAVEKFLAGKEAEAANGTGIIPPSGGAAPVPTEIKSVKDAKGAFEAHLDAIGYGK